MKWTNKIFGNYYDTSSIYYENHDDDIIMNYCTTHFALLIVKRVRTFVKCTPVNCYSL